MIVTGAPEPPTQEEIVAITGSREQRRGAPRIRGGEGRPNLVHVAAQGRVGVAGRQGRAGAGRVAAFRRPRRSRAGVCRRVVVESTDPRALDRALRYGDSCGGSQRPLSLGLPVS